MATAPGVGLEPTTFRLTVGRVCQLSYPGPLRSRPVIGRVGAECSDPGFDFRVARRAEQDALRGLLTSVRERQPKAAVSEREGLRRGVDVVEVQRRGGAVVTAEDARSSCRRDQRLLDPAPAGDHGVRTTLQTPDAATVAAPGERRPAVTCAVGFDDAAVAASSGEIRREA